MADRSALSAVPPKTRKHAEAHLGPDENVLIALVGCDISAIEVNTTWMSGVIEVIVPGYDGRKPTSYWSNDKDKDPFKISNCLPIPKKAASAWQPHLDAIRQKIAQAKHAPSHQTVAPSLAGQGENDFVASLERLQALRAAGALSDEEFQRAKERLLKNSS